MFIEYVIDGSVITRVMVAVLFGTRQTSATEHQHGLMLAIATESIVKLVAFLAAGIFVTFWMFSPSDLIERAMQMPEAVRTLDYTPSPGNFLTMVFLSFCAFMMLPRQFHVSVVENSNAGVDHGWGNVMFLAGAGAYWALQHFTGIGNTGKGAGR